MRSLAEDCSAAIKPTGKVSCVVVWDRKDYLGKAENHLKDTFIYKEVKVSDEDLAKLQLCAKKREKLCKLRKSCNHKLNINRIYNEKFHYNCLQQQLKDLRLRILGNSGIWVKVNENSNCSLVPSLLAQNSIL